MVSATGQSDGRGSVCNWCPLIWNLAFVHKISKDQTFSEAEFPTPDKTVSLSIAQIVKQVHKLEELKNRLKEGSKGNFRELLSKPK